MLTEKVADNFGSGVRSRGLNYYHERRVQLHDFDAERRRIEAVVEGSIIYAVTLEFEPRSKSWVLRANCTCPYMDGGEFCKHIYATLLTIERDEPQSLQSLGPMPARVSLDYLDDDDEADFDDSDGWFEDGDEEDRSDLGDDLYAAIQSRIDEEVRASLGMSTRTASSPAYRRRPPKQKNPKKPPAWQLALSKLPVAPAVYEPPAVTDDSPIKPHYVLEAEDGRTTGLPVLSLAQRKVTVTGKLGKIKKLSINERDIARIQDPADRQICLLLLGAGQMDDYYGYYDRYRYSSSGRSKFAVPASLQSEVFPRISESGRFLLRAQRNGDLTPLRWGAGEPWELVVSIERTGRKKSYNMRPTLRAVR